MAGSGDLAYETGVFVINSVDKNQQSTTINGKYVLVWKKQANGKWKVVADIDNPDSWAAIPKGSAAEGGSACEYTVLIAG